jgi:hypothetical protein
MLDEELYEPEELEEDDLDDDISGGARLPRNPKPTKDSGGTYAEIEQEELLTLSGAIS